ncbi:MAG: hypothetical protein GY906_38120 [bacterium]|nr:hypothetical protein [bacterium]
MNPNPTARLRSTIVTFACLLTAVMLIPPVLAEDACEVPGDLSITEGGKFGIGTLLPLAPLHIFVDETGVLDPNNTLLLLERKGALGLQLKDSLINNEFWQISNTEDNGKLSFWRSNSSVVQMTITSAGNVGIGTASPAGALEIETTGAHADIYFDVTDRTRWKFRNNQSNGQFNFVNDTYSRTPFRVGEEAVNNLLQLGANVGDLVEMNGDLFVTGDVGIGTTTPTAPLHVENDGDVQFVLKNTSGNKWAINNATSLNFAANDSATLMSLNTAGDLGLTGGLSTLGNVGIGTPASSYPLDVVGTAQIRSNLLVGKGVASGAATIDVGSGRSANGYAYIDLIGDMTYTSYGLRLIRGATGENTYSKLAHRGTGSLQIETDEAAPIWFTTDSAVRMTVSKSGDVGIGTQSPKAKLHVMGDFSIKRSGSPAFPNRLQTDLQAFYSYVDDKRVWFFSEQDETVGDYGGFRFVLDDDASVTGGFEIVAKSAETTPVLSMKATGDLTITGSIFTGGVPCGDGCDAVFQPDYELESIEEHAARMWENGHLPEVGPTPENAPINLSDKTGRMLNELEKAHIYIDQLNQVVKRLEAEINELKKK